MWWGGGGGDSSWLLTFTAYIESIYILYRVQIELSEFSIISYELVALNNLLQEMKEDNLIVHASGDLTVSFHDGFFIYGVCHRMNQGEGL